MGLTTHREGTCLCGKVKIDAREASNEVGACHCGSCRRWGGGPFIELNCGTQVTITGEEHVTRYRSSEWAERGFCSACGTHLFYHLTGPGQYMIPVGVFTTDDNLKFESQVFIEEKPGYYQFANETHNMTGAELFAKFAPPE